MGLCGNATAELGAPPGSCRAGTGHAVRVLRAALSGGAKAVMQVRAGAPAVDVRLAQQRAQHAVGARRGCALLLLESVAALLPLSGPAAAAQALGAVSTRRAIRQLFRRLPRADLRMTSISQRGAGSPLQQHQCLQPGAASIAANSLHSSRTIRALSTAGQCSISEHLVGAKPAAAI